MTRTRLAIALPTLLVALVAFLMSSCIALNRSPIASFTRSPSSGDVPLSVFFDASDSIDADGTIVAYAWNLGDGTIAAGLTVSHTYAQAGTFEATLTVTDDRGGEGRATRAIVTSNPVAPPTTGTEIGELAPEFTLRSLDGVETSLAQYRGYVVVLDFWRSSCPPCRLTMPHLEALRARFAADGLVAVTVNLDETEAKARDFLNENGFTEFVVLRGSLEKATAVRFLYGVDGIPHTFVLDRQGIVRYTDHPIRLRDYHIEPWL